MDKLFVYGSLKKDGNLHPALDDSKFLGDYITESNGYVMTSAGNFPFVFYTTPKNPFHIKGELYEVDKKVLNLTHRIEVGAGYDFKEIDKGIYGYLYPTPIIGETSNSIRVNEDEKYFEWLNSADLTGN